MRDGMDIIQSTREDIGRIATQLARTGWAEANAGNISVLLPEGADDKLWENQVFSDTLPISMPELAGRTFLVTCAWSRFRTLQQKLDTEIVPVRVSSDGLRIIRLEGSRNPTSEFSTHILVLAGAVSRGWTTAALVHTHSTHMLALSSSDLPGEMLEDAVNRSHPEISLLLGRGVRFLDYTTPGTWELGAETAKAFENSDCVIWRKHGILGLGRDIDSACDAVEVVEKAARLLLLEKSAFGKFVGLKNRELVPKDPLSQEESDEEINDTDGDLPPGPPIID